MPALAQVIPLIVVTVIFWAMIIRPQIAAIRKPESLKSKLPITSEKVDIDASYKSYRTTLAGWAQVGVPSGIFAVLSLLGLALFLWKITQTSDLALRYSNQTHTAMGEWIIGLGILFLITVGLALPTLRAQRAFKEAKEKFKTDLKDALAIAKDQSETREVIDIEEMLNTLPKTGLGLFAELKNIA